MKPFEGIEILNILPSGKSERIVDLEFASKEEFIKAASLQNEKINGHEFFVRFSSFTRRPQQADRDERER